MKRVRLGPHPRAVRKLPAAVVAAAEKLRRFPGVVGVFWGYGSTKGRRHEEKRLCIHVQWKRPERLLRLDETIKREFEGFETDVIETGVPLAHSLAHTDALVGAGLVRHGTIAAVARDDTNGALALMSGHVALPVKNGRIVHSYPGSGTSGSARVEVPETGGGSFFGRVQRGSMAGGGALDFALARFEQATGVLVETDHTVAGSPPFATRRVALIDGERLRHYSRLPRRAKIIKGRYDQHAATSTDVALPDGTTGTYTNLIAVASTDTLCFSEGGDSGSLVVDDARRVVGMILGSSADGSMAYVLPIAPLVDTLGISRRAFFA